MLFHIRYILQHFKFMNWWIQNSALSTIVWLQCGIRIVKAKLKTKQKNHFALGQPVTLLHYWSIHWIYWNQIHKTKYQNPKYFLLCKWKFNKFFIQQALEGLKFQNKQTQKQMIQTFGFLKIFGFVFSRLSFFFKFCFILFSWLFSLLI